MVSTIVAGTARAKGFTNGVGNFPRFNWPSGLAVDGDGNIIVADLGNIYYSIRKITPQGHVSTLAGTDEEGHRE